MPSVADLRARQMEATTAALRDALGADDLDRFSAVVDELVGTRPTSRDIARAAIKLVHEARESTVDEVEIPEFVPRDDGPKRERGDRPGPRQASGQPGGRYQGGAKTRLFIGLGRKDRVRPGDLVGAIANESDLTGRDIGPINITDNFSTVDVPAAAADAVIAAIKQTTIQGKRPTIRRDRHQHADPPVLNRSRRPAATPPPIGHFWPRNPQRTVDRRRAVRAWEP